MIKVCLILLLLILMITPAMADEFSADQLKPGWELIQGLEENAFKMGQGMAVFNSAAGSLSDGDASGSMKLLRTPLEGEWIIEIDMQKWSADQGDYLHGIVLWLDADHYLALANTRDGAVVQGRLAGQDTGVIARDNSARYLRIRKYTRGSDHAAYQFYTSYAGYQDFNCIGSYEDTGHLLDNARYGLIAGSQLAGSSTYDAFTERIAQNDYDSFFGGQLESIWQLHNVSAASVYKGLKISGKLENAPAAVVKPPLTEDWIADTALQARSNKECLSGLMLYGDKDHYLLIGAFQLNKVQVLLCENGEQTLVADIKGASKRFKIEKDGDCYSLFHKTDTSLWQPIYTFEDTIGWARNAQYGMAVSGAEGLSFNSTFTHFREYPLANGLIEKVESTEEIGPVMGRTTGVINNTEDLKWIGADLGHFLEYKDQLFMMFGDSNNGTNHKGNRWWSNTLVTIDQAALEQDMGQLKFDTFMAGFNGTLYESITGSHSGYRVVTDIPNTGLVIGDRIYYHCMSVYRWGDVGHWDVNGSFWAYSDNGGKSFRCSPILLDGNSGFVVTYAVPGDDGYIYLYGTSSKLDGISLLRFREEDILDAQAYEYCMGEDDQGQALWSSRVEDAAIILPGCTGEFCAFYHPELNRYFIINQDVHTMDIIIRDSDRLTGGYSNPVVLVDHTLPAFKSYNYSPNTLARFFRAEEGELYFTLSRWDPYVVYWEKAQITLRQQ